mgnify:CR=1 FL=1
MKKSKIMLASILKDYAEDVSIYSTSHGKYEDIEWALKNCDIHIINGSVNYRNNANNYYQDPVAIGSTPWLKLMMCH